MKFVNFNIDMYERVNELWEICGITLGSSDTRDQVQRVLNYSADLFFVGIKDNKIIAVVIGAFDGRRGYVHHLAVDPKLQKEGYGRLMMEELHKRFKEKKIHKVHLFVEVDNEGVIEFYKKVGWHTRDDLKMMSFVP
ncbi:MAG: GNAT family N-acetyltransferase [Candidatus Thorarchaeota archaeon]